MTNLDLGDVAVDALVEGSEGIADLSDDLDATGSMSVWRIDQLSVSDICEGEWAGQPKDSTWQVARWKMKEKQSHTPRGI